MSAINCPQCQSTNPEDANFCMACGAKLDQVCRQCGASVPLRANFCTACGQRIEDSPQSSHQELSIQEKLDKVQRYLPKGVLKKVLAQKENIEGERRQVTILFCDMQSFTGLTAKLGPDDTFALMDRVFEILLHTINHYQGTVNEFRGDGVVAFFGAPIALEDAPQRAIRAALKVHRAIRTFNEEIHEKWEADPIQLRIGLNTGKVVVGTVGNDLRVQYAAVGDTINMAARMETLAEPGTVYVTKETFQQTEGYFRFEALGAQYIKGKPDPIEVYKVIAPSNRRTRFDVSTERGLTPFVGRQRELDLLLDGYQRSKTGHGQSFAIVSEAGLGKSRLLYEFRKKIIHDNVTFLEGRCLSYGRGMAYHPVIDALKSNFNLNDTDDANTITAKVDKGLKAITADDPVTRGYILELLSVADAKTQAPPVSQEEKKYRLIEALKRIVIKGAERRPLVLAVEDLHWMDQSSEDAFKSLLASISASRAFLIFTYRPEYVHTWGTRTYHSQINLNRFSNRESLMMVHHLLGTNRVEDALEELILEKVEGVPFFIEEFIRSLKALSIIEEKHNQYRLAKSLDEIAVPNTIQGVIMSRVDALPESARSILVTGAAIGREFSHTLLKNIADIDEQELLTCLSILKEAELLYERGLYPQSTYIFKHALTQEVVYDSIIRPKRRQLHESIGQNIEALYQENLHEYYGVLTEHYTRCGNYAKSADFCELASKQAAGSASFHEAIGHARNLIFVLERLPQNTNTQISVIKARTALAFYLINISQNEGLLDAVAPIESLAASLPDKKKIARIYIALGIYYYSIEENIEKGLKYLNETSNLLPVSKDFLSAYYAYFYLGCHYTWNVQFSEAHIFYNKCIDLSTAAQNPIGVSNPKALAVYAYCYEGRLDKARPLAAEGLQSAEQNDYLFCKIPAYTAHGIYSYYKGAFDEAEKYLRMGLDCSQKVAQIGWEHWACLNLGNLYLDIAKFPQAKEFLNRSLSIILQYKLLPSWVHNCHVALNKMIALNNDTNISLQESFKAYDNNNFKVNRGYIARNISEILLLLGNKMLSEAKSWITTAIENDQQHGMLWSLGRDYAVYAQILKKSQESEKADECLRRALDLFTNCGAHGWTKKIQEDFAGNAK